MPRRLSRAFLCAVPLLAIGLTVPRSLRIPGVHPAIGLVHFLAILIAAWAMCGEVLRVGGDDRRRVVVAGALLLVPFALISLFWVGLGTPWEATPVENRMRYLVLLASSMAVAIAFVFLKESLCEAGERVFSILGFAANIFAGTAYMIWLVIYIAVYVVKVRDGALPEVLNSAINMSDILLFVACVLTYVTVAAFAASMGRIGWLGRGATRVYLILNFVALVCILIRGLSFPDPTASSTPWYTQPGFIAGIPAIPWIMPYYLGVGLVCRAGDGRVGAR